MAGQERQMISYGGEADKGRVEEIGEAVEGFVKVLGIDEQIARKSVTALEEFSGGTADYSVFGRVGSVDCSIPDEGMPTLGLEFQKELTYICLNGGRMQQETKYRGTVVEIDCLLRGEGAERETWRLIFHFGGTEDTLTVTRDFGVLNVQHWVHRPNPQRGSLG